MVYLLKWLISLITPHTHDKEGKQGKSFIVRKALGNRASFSSLASKKGSSLLLVVMTMSVIIVISSSFMLLSFNTGIGSIFASSQQKAQLSCLSVAEGLKDGTNFGNVVDHYNAQLRTSPTNEAEFEANGNGLAGKTTVKLKATFNGSTYDSIKVTVTTVVGGSKYELSFMQNMTSDSIMDVINQVSNSMSVSGGGSFSMQTGQVVGDLSLNGDYLLAMNKKDNKPGLIDGNVYCNGSMVIGYRDADGNGISTRITKNLYVNGDLIINACEIDGDVYVSGNVLVNGLTKSEKINSSAVGPVIKGNLYVGGSLYATLNGFSEYYPTVEKISTDNFQVDNELTETGGFCFENGFPKPFPTETKIRENSEIASKVDYAIQDVDDTKDDYVYILKNNTKVILYRDILKTFNTGYTLKYNRSDNYERIFGDDENSKAVIESFGSTKRIVIYAHAAMRYRKSTDSGINYYYQTNYYNRAYNALFNLLTGVYWGNDDEDSDSKKYGQNTTLKQTIVKDYEAATFAAKIDSLTNIIGTDTLTVSNNVYVQGNAFIEVGNRKFGASTYICGDLISYSVSNLKLLRSEYDDSLVVSFKNLYVGGTAEQIKLKIDRVLNVDENYYQAYMSLYATGVNTAPRYKGDDRVYKTGKYFKFWQGESCDEFDIDGSESDYQTTSSSDDFKAENLGNPGVKEGATLVEGIMSYGTTAFFYQGTEVPSGYKGKKTYTDFSNSSLFAFKNTTDFNDDNEITDTERKQMYSDMFLQNHNASSGLRDEQLRATTISTVADVFKEMGVYGYNASEVTAGAHRKGYIEKVKYSYDNLAKSGYSKYEVGANKLNDYEGVNFTGVTSATQVRFAYTLQKAVNAKEKGTMTVTGKGSIKHPGMISSGDESCQRILFKSGYKYNNKIGNQNIENLTEYWINGAGNIGDTFYGRLLFLGTYDKNILWRDNNYSETSRGASEAKRWEAFNNDVKEVMGYLYDLPTCTYANDTERQMWNKYRNYYVGVFAYNPDDKLCVYLMRDIYLGGDSYYGFGDADTDDNKNGFNLYLDTSEKSINVYWGSDANGMLNFASKSYIEISILFPKTSNNFNVAYMYLLPNFAMSNYPTSEYKIMTYEEKVANVADMAGAVPTNDYVDGQRVYKGASGRFYRYSVKYYKDIDLAKDKDGLFGKKYFREVLNTCKFSYVVRMWDKCRIKNTAVKDSNGQILSAGIPFVMCEGPMLFMMGQEGEMSGIIYSPNPNSVFFCASSTAKGTLASDINTTFSGGAVVTGRVVGTKGNEGTWAFFEDNTKYDVGKLLTEALIKADGGLGGMQTENGTDSSTKWSAGGYE